MFDSNGAFTKQFVPHDGGYIYYPSRRSGGKFVTAAEYERLAANWHRVSGRAGIWKIAGIAVITIAVWTALSSYFEFSELYNQLMTYAMVAAISGRLIWSSFAPRRLVSNRAAVVPRRPSAIARRDARGLLDWRFIVFGIAVTGILFVGCLITMQFTVRWWAGVIATGLLFGVYLWTGIQKIRDQR